MPCCGETKAKPLTEIVQHKDRNCTDILWLLVWLAHWIAIAVIFAEADRLGGNPDRIIKARNYKGEICTGDRGGTFGTWPYPPEFRFTICVPDCAYTGDRSQNQQMIVHYESFQFGQWCVPKPNGTVAISIELGGDFEDTSEEASRAMGDMFVAWPVILTSAFGCLVVAFLYVWFTEKCAGCMVTVAFFTLIAAGAVLTSAFWDKYEEYEKTEVENRAKAMQALAIVTGGSTILLIIAVFVLRDRIRIAIAVVKDAAAALQDMRALICFPVIPVFVGMGFCVWWISIALWIFSVGDDVPVPVEQDSCLFWGQSGYPTGLTTPCTQCLTATFVDCSTPTQGWATTITGTYDANGDGINSGLMLNQTNFLWNEDMKRAMAFHFFSLLWQIQYLIYFTYMVACGAVADWYFTEWADYESRDKKRGQGPGELSNTPIWDSVKRTLRFHMGTLALGSFIIAVIQFIRATVLYIEKQMKGKDQSWYFKCIMRMIHCCLWCAECCMDKINKNAFIWCAIYGDSFATSACSSFQLIWSNLMRVAAINLVGGYLTLLGKIVIAILTTACAAGYMSWSEYYKENLTSIVMPCVIIFLLAYLIASLFMAIFETVIDVTFFCFLVDEDVNGRFEDGGHMLASKELQEVVRAHMPASKEQCENKMSRTFTHKDIQQRGAETQQSSV